MCPTDVLVQLGATFFLYSVTLLVMLRVRLSITVLPEYSDANSNVCGHGNMWLLRGEVIMCCSVILSCDTSPVKNCIVS